MGGKNPRCNFETPFFFEIRRYSVAQQRQVPYPDRPEDVQSQFAAFIELVRILRTDCPWDRKQSHESISHLLIEEAYETIDAIAKGDDREFSKELGDLLLHVVMHGVLAEERKAFSLHDIIQQEFDKLVRRHPHVFGDTTANDAEQVKQNWEEIKMKEGRSSVLEGVPASLPALLRAQRMQEKASNVGFDWDKKSDVWNKVEEELREFRQELQSGNSTAASAEFGDLVFALVNAARFEGIIVEEALQATNKKFARRFRFIEEQATAQGKTVRDMTLGEMDDLWNKAKELETIPHGNNTH